MRAFSSDGETLTLFEGSRIAEWGGDLAGTPGTGYAKLLADTASGDFPVVSYWNETTIVSDNRIAALESAASSYRFEAPAGTARVEVTLLFRRLFQPIAERFGIPITVTGFEPLDLLHGIYLTVKALEEGRAEVENQYKRAVRREGNAHARALLNEVFTVCDRAWRGFGVIPGSGFGLAPAFADFDAAIRFPQAGEPAAESAECIAGEVLRGRKKPHECPAYGTRCTPEKPLGAPMVSSEGACAAYYAYARHEL